MLAVVAAVWVLLLASCGSPEGPSLVAGPTETDGNASLAGVSAETPLVITTDESGARRSLTVSGDGGSLEDRPVLSLVPLASDQAITVSEAPTATTVSRPVTPEASGPTGLPLVIFDTDLGPDVDDALALAMLHGYQKRGAIEIAAVTLSRNSPTGARYADALNTFYGRPDIPIGIDKGNAPYFSDTTNFVALASQWPHDLNDGDIDEAYKLHRRVMARGLAEGRPVIVIQVGFSGNLSKLVNSGGDEISPKSGVELIRDSVSVLSLMGGSIDRNMVEFNIENDVASARNLFAKWPGRIIVSPFELGYGIHYPYSSIRNDLSGRHILRESYEFRDLDWHQDAPPFYNMRTWDLTAVMEAVEPSSGYFFVSQPGVVTVDGSGRTFFNVGGGQHYVLDRSGQYSGDQRDRILRRMIELVSDTP